MPHLLNVICLAAIICLHCHAADEWATDVGKPAPRLNAAGWVGTPVSLDAVKGNTVILGFWNADVAC